MKSISGVNRVYEGSLSPCLLIPLEENWMLNRDKREKARLEERKAHALSSIERQKFAVDLMAQRATARDSDFNEAQATAIQSKLNELTKKAEGTDRIETLDDLIDQAEEQAQLRAYFCPIDEILTDGRLALDLMEEWNVPKSITARLRALLGKKLERAGKEADEARGALRALFEEYDSWST
jgi:hypothetical protein